MLAVATAKVVLIDDHEILRAGVRDLLDSLPGYEVVGETSTACAGLAIVESERPDIVLMSQSFAGWKRDPISTRRGRAPRIHLSVREHLFPSH